MKADLCNHEVPGEDEAQEVHEAGGGSQQFRVPGGDLVDEGVQQLRAAGHQTHRVNQHLHAGQNFRAGLVLMLTLKARGTTTWGAVSALGPLPGRGS